MPPASQRSPTAMSGPTLIAAASPASLHPTQDWSLIPPMSVRAPGRRRRRALVHAASSRLELDPSPPSSILESCSSSARSSRRVGSDRLQCGAQQIHHRRRPRRDGPSSPLSSTARSLILTSSRSRDRSLEVHWGQHARRARLRNHRTPRPSSLPSRRELMRARPSDARPALHLRQAPPSALAGSRERHWLSI